MIDYFLKISFYPKKMIYLHVIMFLYTLLLWLMFDRLGEPCELLLFKETYLLYQSNIVKLLMFGFLLISLLYLLIDHDERYHALLITYKNRLSFTLWKILAYIVVYTYVVFLFYIITDAYFYRYLRVPMQNHSAWISFYLDGLIVFFIYLFFIRHKFKTLSLILPINIMILHMIFSDQQALCFFYILPVLNPKEGIYMLAISYKLWYICFWLYLNLLK